MRFNATRLINLRGINDLPIIARQPVFRRHEGRATYVTNLICGFTLGNTVRDFNQCTLGIAKN